jgi:hypothetical protein
MLGLLMPRYVADAEFGDAEVAFVAHNIFKRSDLYLLSVSQASNHYFSVIRQFSTHNLPITVSQRQRQRWRL